MSIEARGARHPYLVAFHGMAVEIRPGRSTNHHHYCRGFIVANSDDEAQGMADRIARIIYPDAEEWVYRHALPVQIGDIGWVGQFDEKHIKSAKRPW